MDIRTRLKSLRQQAGANPVVTLAWITFSVVTVLNPAKVGVLIYGICKLTAFAHAGNWMDCRIFGHAQPEMLDGVEQGTAWKRKALIVAASIIAGALAP